MSLRVRCMPELLQCAHTSASQGHVHHCCRPRPCMAAQPEMQICGHGLPKSTTTRRACTVTL